MRIISLSVNSFRNIRNEKFIFDENMNIFFGKNAQGKTNLLEAISLCIGKSFRRCKPLSTAPFGDEESVTEMELVFISDIYPEKKNKILYKMYKGKVSVSYNDIPLKSAIELYGVMKYVVFIPEHLSIIKGTPDIRREYLDNVAIMQTQTHLKKLSAYNRALKQRNFLLSGGKSVIDPEQLAVWNEGIIREGINVTFGRLKYFDFLSDYAGELYSQLAGKNELLTMKYSSNVFGDIKPDFEKKDELYQRFEDALRNGYENDLKFGYTTVGVHRDDVEFYINEHSAREFASQGQVRSAALVIKLAEAEIIRRRNKETPVVLLDEVLSELDRDRRRFITSHIDNSQVFITTCNMNDAENFGKGAMWEVEDGKFKRK